MSSDPGRNQETSAQAAKPARRRKLRVVLVVILALAALIGASAVANIVLERVERSSVAPYGERIHISGGDVNVYRAHGDGQTIVLLSGLGTAAPALDFKPLIQELHEYDVIVVEGFGYGYSDRTDKPRTVENITAELHETLSKLDIDAPYVLAGHSIAGFYTQFYADRYPDEVSAIIGIDATVPAASAADRPDEAGGGINWEGILSATGVVRIVTALAPGLLEPEGDFNYTSSEREQIKMLGRWNFGTATVFDETARIGQNAAVVYPLRYADDLPVLNFLASGKSTWTPELLQRNEDRLQDVPNQKIVVLDGDHYLHHTHSKQMAAEITAFLDSVSTAP
jgi:pimeloyl-ACP methyl ester carboxylesterase